MYNMSTHPHQLTDEQVNGEHKLIHVLWCRSELLSETQRQDLIERHSLIVTTMACRGMRHYTPLTVGGKS